MNISELFHKNAEQFSGQTAIIDESAKIDFGSLSVSIRETAAALQAFDLKPGMGIGVLGSNSRWFIQMAYAVMESEAVVLPLSDQLKRDEIQDVIRISGLHALLFEAGLQDKIPLADNAVDFLHGWKINFFDTGSGPIAPHVPGAALIRFTSGTTGISKGVILSHQTILDRITVANGALKLGPGDRVLWVLSMAYHFVVSIILYLHHGAAIVICNDFLASAMLEKINEHRATFIYASPMHIRMLAQDKSLKMMESVRCVISTSTAVSAGQCEAFYSRFNKSVSQA
jgi:acyl-coenzyme A synthetase/AMP-(fatty) acid ligase